MSIEQDVEAKFKATRERVDKFAKTHPRLDELGKVVAIGVEAGLGLKEAYAVAVALDRLTDGALGRDAVLAVIKRLIK